MPRLIYLIGPPGVGKTTAMREATAEWTAVPAVSERGRVPFTRLVDGDGIVRAIELGVRRDPFGGTDGMSMSIGPAAARFLATRPHDVVLGEGQRLATRPFLEAATCCGYAVTLVALSLPDHLLVERWASRGTEQAAGWRKAAQTRVRNLAGWAATLGGILVVSLDASGPPGFVGDEVRDLM